MNTDTELVFVFFYIFVQKKEMLLIKIRQHSLANGNKEKSW